MKVIKLLQYSVSFKAISVVIRGKKSNFKRGILWKEKKASRLMTKGKTNKKGEQRHREQTVNRARWSVLG